MKIKKAVSSDIKELFSLEQRLFSPENFPLSRASFAYHVKNNLIYVAKIEDEIAGYILALIKRKSAKLYSVGVDNAWRKKKIAFRLLKKMSEELRGLGFKNVLLEVRTDNEKAIELYKSFGFTFKKRVKEFYRDGCDAYIMEFEYADTALQDTL